MTTRTTHTYAVLGVSESAYNEIREKLEKAGYTHAFMENGTIDMHGIGINKEAHGEGTASEGKRRETS